MKILITGGNGYIARNLKPLFEQNGYEVVAPSRTELDLLNLEYLTTFLQYEKFDAIIHAASMTSRKPKDGTFEQVYLPNIQMFENLYMANMWRDPAPVILLGSGAEFDRRGTIKNVREEDVFNRWPIDPYGLSKNVITRRALSDFDRMYVLRLFGCFNWDDEPVRLVRSGIENIKRGLPIKVNCHKQMDYFYMDDVFLVMDYLLKHGGPRNINLVYDEKTDLMGIAELICKHMNGFNCKIEIVNPRQEADYTGCSEVLYSLPVADQLFGLEDGIRRTVRKLT